MLFVERLVLSAPLFAMVLVGALIARLTRWPAKWTVVLNRFVFTVPLPVVLFQAVSQVGGETKADPRLLIAFFGSCFVVFGLGYWTARVVLRQTAAGPAMVGIASVFSNNGLLGVPLVHLLLGPEAMPAVAWIMTFNAVTLWTLATVVIERSKQNQAHVKSLTPDSGSVSLSRTLVKVGSSPIVIGIACGALVAVFGVSVPSTMAQVLDVVSHSAGPLALVALGLDVARYKVKQELSSALVICSYKLLLQPVVAWALCLVLGLPKLETQVVVLMASLSVGVNAHLMAQHFASLQTAVASSLVLSTLIGALTTPLVLALVY